MGRFPLPLARIITRSFDADEAFGPDALRIFNDLGVAYGMPEQAAGFVGRRRTTFTTMVESLVAELTDPDDPIGLVVLAHGTPDSEPHWPACFLAHMLPGDPFTFAVADHGVTTPFLALRIAAEYIRADDLGRAAVVILEQEEFFCDPALVGQAPMPAENRLVALVFDRAGTLGTVAVAVTADTEPELPAVDGSSVLVVGGRLAATNPPLPSAVVASAHLPGTGTWSALHDGLDRWRGEGAEQVTLIDYDPASRVQGRCTLTLRSA
ncbi:hypothetical protein [Allocatelliglobosispora scoriae]|uniref:hypothetical protein n=1 Tax=Allocatelliglobosispora scoriae TaxID=643052 RepID=UPI001C887413|nr:hypothetical protein [Allocatelliglobosispora scoriae]